jgi:hypothetical protein
VTSYATDLIPHWERVVERPYFRLVVTTGVQQNFFSGLTFGQQPRRLKKNETATQVEKEREGTCNTTQEKTLRLDRTDKRRYR